MKFINNLNEYNKKKNDSIKELNYYKKVEKLDLEHHNALIDIKREFPDFDEQEFLNYVNNVIPNIHYFISNDKIERAEKYCSKELIQKMLEQKEKYRISKKMDNINIQYIRITGFQLNNNRIYLKVYASVYFYDEATNNLDNKDLTDKFWNDIWTITVTPNTKIGGVENAKCPKCGATMIYDYHHQFHCEYCRNNLYITNVDYIVTDIEVKE